MRARLTAELPPPLWIGFCHHQLRLDADRAGRWWEALQQAEGKHAVTLRGVVLARATFGPGQRMLEQWVTEYLTPRTLMAALEEVAADGLLPLHVVHELEDRLLQELDAGGSWRHGVRLP
jgi:hypothetical protein